MCTPREDALRWSQEGPTQVFSQLPLGRARGPAVLAAAAALAALREGLWRCQLQASSRLCRCSARCATPVQEDAHQDSHFFETCYFASPWIPESRLKPRLGCTFYMIKSQTRSTLPDSTWTYS